MGMQQLDGWCKSTPFYCPCAIHLDRDEFKKTSILLGASGHDNRELESDRHSGQTNRELKAARDRAVARCKAEGVCFTVDES